MVDFRDVTSMNYPCPFSPTPFQKTRNGITNVNTDVDTKCHFGTVFV